MGLLRWLLDNLTGQRSLGNSSNRGLSEAPRQWPRPPYARGGGPGGRHASRRLVHLLTGRVHRPARPYWQVRGWRRCAGNLFLGHFKTRLGRRHGVIKWNSPHDFSVYVHDVPSAILAGPHGRCFQEVKPGKFRVHFAQLPQDLNSAIFYIETLLQEAFEHE